jgi:hypothetical protein
MKWDGSALMGDFRESDGQMVSYAFLSRRSRAASLTSSLIRSNCTVTRPWGVRPTTFSASREKWSCHA